MALQPALKGARNTGQQITWTRTDGVAQNLTGATLSGRMKNIATGTAVAIDGVLSLVTAASGIFNWAYGAVDVGTAGVYEVQLKATYTLFDVTFSELMVVEDVF